MKTIQLTRPSRQLSDLLNKAQSGDIVVETPAGELFLVSAIDDFEYEIAQQRKNRKLMAFLDERFRKGRDEPGIPLEQVRRNLKLSTGRPAKRKPAPKTIRSRAKP